MYASISGIMSGCSTAMYMVKHMVQVHTSSTALRLTLTNSRPGRITWCGCVALGPALPACHWAAPPCPHTPALGFAPPASLLVVGTHYPLIHMSAWKQESPSPLVATPPDACVANNRPTTWRVTSHCLHPHWCFCCPPSTGMGGTCSIAGWFHSNSSNP